MLWTCNHLWDEKASQLQRKVKFLLFLWCKYFETGKTLLSLSKRIMRYNYSNSTAQLQIQAHGRCVGSPYIDTWLTRDGGFVDLQLPNLGSVPVIQQQKLYISEKKVSSHPYLSSDRSLLFSSQKVIHCIVFFIWICLRSSFSPCFFFFSFCQ